MCVSLFCIRRAKGYGSTRRAISILALELPLALPGEAVQPSLADSAYKAVNRSGGLAKEIQLTFLLSHKFTIFQDCSLLAMNKLNRFNVFKRKSVRFV